MNAQFEPPSLTNTFSQMRFPDMHNIAADSARRFHGSKSESDCDRVIAGATIGTLDGQGPARTEKEVVRRETNGCGFLSSPA